MELQREKLKETERPSWINRKIDFKLMHACSEKLSGLNLHTVCHQALCPNISECYARGTATFMILGKHCTRNCSFCNVISGTPSPVDHDEPARITEAVHRLSLKYTVITSVTRDDLPDGGASVFAAVTRSIKERTPNVKVELLVPDFKGSSSSIETVLKSTPDVFAHNIEMVPSYYHLRKGASYSLSLAVLKKAKAAGAVKTKTGLMLGFGEKVDEVISTLKEIRDHDCDYISIGQYLRPSLKNTPVARFVTPQEFDEYRDAALSMGFLHVESAPYVRSSYMADSYT